MNNWYLPLMSNNISKEDILSLRDFLDPENIPQLTNGPKVLEFEREWSNWLGTSRTIMVNSGSSANILTLLTIRELFKDGKDEILVSPLAWVSDVSSIIHAGLKPVFCDINLKNLSFDLEKFKKCITAKTKAVIVVSVLGINPYSEEFFNICKENNILVIGDHCESHGATYKGQKLGSLKEEFVSNFSGYYAHHLSTIESGLISCNSEEFYEYLRIFRSHSLLRESTDQNLKNKILLENPEVNKEFVFLTPSFNFRTTEISGVLGLSQLKRLDSNNEKRKSLFNYFIKNLDSYKYITELEIEGQCAYSFIVIQREFNKEKYKRLSSILDQNKIEHRSGLSGGGNQLRSPYLKNFKWNSLDFPNIEHIHYNSCYIGLYPTLEKEKIDFLLEVLNNI